MCTSDMEVSRMLDSRIGVNTTLREDASSRLVVLL